MNSIKVLLILLLAVVVIQQASCSDDDDDEFGDIDDDEEESDHFFSEAVERTDHTEEEYEDNNPFGSTQDDDEGVDGDEEDFTEIPTPKKKENRPPPPTDVLGIILSIPCLIIVGYAAYQWHTGSQQNEEIAKMYAATVFEYLMEHFNYVGFGKPKLQEENCEDPILSKDGARWFYLHATGMSNVKYCTITLQLRARQNIFKMLWEAYAGVKPDKVIIEMILKDNTTTTPFVFGLAKGSSCCDEMKDIGTDFEQFITQPKTASNHIIQDSSASLSDWKKHLKHPLNVLCDCPEALKPSNGLFTSQVLGIINFLAVEDIFQYLHISDQLVELHESRWRDTQLYETEKAKRHRNAESVKSLKENSLGVRLCFNLPIQKDFSDRYHSENLVILPHHLAIYLAHKLSSFVIPQSSHQRQVRKHNEPLETLYKEIKEKQLTEKKKKEQRAEVAEQKQKQKETIASVTKSGPPKARAVYG